MNLYNDTVEIDFKESSHRYKVDGKPTIGVSTILGTLSKDLMGWSAWMAAEAFRDSVMPYATTDKKITKAFLKQLAKDARMAHTKRSQTGMDVGTIVHKWIEEETDFGYLIRESVYVADLLLNAKTVEEREIIEENVKAAEHCVKQWRQWMKDYDIAIIRHEFVVYSKKLDYCGTADVLFKSRRTGKIYLGDYKTSEPEKVRNSKYQIVDRKAYPEHFAQVSGYDYAHHEEFGVNPDGYAVIYLPKEDDYHQFTREQVVSDRENWEHLVHVYRWIKNIRSNHV